MLFTKERSGVGKSPEVGKSFRTIVLARVGSYDHEETWGGGDGGSDYKSMEGESPGERASLERGSRTVTSSCCLQLA